MAGADRSRTLLRPEFARYLASDLRYRHGFDPSLAIPIQGIAESEGARVLYERLVGEGALSHDAEGYVIRVRIDATLYRRRFTVAHELGHLMLERLGVASSPRASEFQRTKSHDSEERFCDSFAAYLLVPDESIVDLSDWSELTIPRLLEHRERLGASLEALAWRVAEVLPGDGGVLWFRYMGKPNDANGRRLRLDWGVFPHRDRLFLPKYAAVPFTSPVHAAFTSQDYQELSNVPLNFGSLREHRSLLVKSLGPRLLALVKPREVV